jgi:hypothetical protein
MKPWKLVALVLAVLLVGSFAMAGAAATGKPGGHSSFTLRATTITAGEEIERGYTWTDRVTTIDGKELGWDGGRCINLVAPVEPPGDTPQDKWMCEMVFHLPDGDITSAAAFDLAGIIAGEADIVFAVTGGTGDFRNARGELEVVPETETEALVHFWLRGARACYDHDCGHDHDDD